MSSCFLIVGPNDACLFEYSTTPRGGNNGDGDDDGDAAAAALTRQMLAYSSLDLIDDAVWARADYHLGRVDRLDGAAHTVAAFVGLAPVRLVLLQQQSSSSSSSSAAEAARREQAVRRFFVEAYARCACYLLGPFARPTQAIRSARVRDDLVALCQKYL